jgi:medium-chain acyl-[acyl-carrier-protein] hydrolase
MTAAAMIERTTERWIGLRRPARAPRARLFSFSYAGGGATAYRAWMSDLAHEEWLEWTAVQLPGRESRSAEPAYQQLAPLLDDLERTLGPETALPYALFGYSMGALLAYELALRLTRNGAPPRLLIVAARRPPHRVRARHTPPSREEILAKVRRLGGTVAEVLESDMFDRHYLPILAADFAVTDMFERALPQILPCPILALGANDDAEVPADDIHAWGTVAGRGFEAKLFDGGHFFLHTAHEQVMAAVNAAIGEWT